MDVGGAEVLVEPFQASGAGGRRPGAAVPLVRVAALSAFHRPPFDDHCQLTD